jgi:hypothetical protein
VNRGAAAACYFPVPVLAWLVARAAPDDRLVRHHARQAGWLTILAWSLLLAAGSFLQNPALTVVAGTVVALAGLGILVGVLSAASGRFVRVRPVWDLTTGRRG